MYTWEEMYDILLEVVGVSEESLDLAFGIAGCSEDTACAILNYYTGWKTFEGYLGEFEDEDEIFIFFYCGQACAPGHLINVSARVPDNEPKKSYKLVTNFYKRNTRHKKHIKNSRKK